MTEPDREEPGAALAARMERRLTVAGYLANGIGALIVALFLALFVPVGKRRPVDLYAPAGSV